MKSDNPFPSPIFQPGHTPSGLGPTVHQRNVLHELKRRLVKLVGGDSDEHFARAFVQLDTNLDRKLSLFEFVDGLSRLGYEMDDSEMTTVIQLFDRNHDNFISPEEFFIALKAVQE